MTDTDTDSAVPSTGLRIRDEDGIAVLELCHGKANALDLELCDALCHELHRLAAARGVVLTGSGGIFSAGVDLYRVLAEDRSYLEAFFRAFDCMLRRLLALPRPLVAAVGGHALAGGWILAATGDYRLGARGPATVGLPELRVGVPFPGIALHAVAMTAPRQWLEPLVYLAEPLPIADAFDRGLLHELTAPEDLVPRAVAVAARMGDLPAHAFARTKQALRALHGPPPEDTLEETVELWHRDETRAAMRRFLDSLRQR